MQKNIWIVGAEALKVFFLSFLLEYNKENNAESFCLQKLLV